VCVRHFINNDPTPWGGTSQNGQELLFITALPNTKLCAWGEEDSGGLSSSPHAPPPPTRTAWGEGKLGGGGHVLWDTTSRGLCGLV
jgi:hypothetical protein